MTLSLLSNLTHVKDSARNLKSSPLILYEVRSRTTVDDVCNKLRLLLTLNVALTINQLSLYQIVI
jgi:hypothetical protein